MLRNDFLIAAFGGLAIGILLMPIFFWFLFFQSW